MRDYSIAVAVQNDKSCHKAVDFAVEMARSMKQYKLYFVYVVPISPKTKLPVIDRLESGYNLEVHEEAKRDMRELLTYLDNTTDGKVEYEFVKLEEELSTEEILSQFVSSTKPNVFVVGSHRHGSLKRFVLGSVSQFCVDHFECPVIVVKPSDKEHSHIA